MDVAADNPNPKNIHSMEQVSVLLYGYENPPTDYETALLARGFLRCLIKKMKFNWSNHTPESNDFWKAFPRMYQDFIKTESDASVYYRSLSCERDDFLKLLRKFLRLGLFTLFSSSTVHFSAHLFYFSRTCALAVHLIDMEEMSCNASTGVLVFWFDQYARVAVTTFGTDVSHFYGKQRKYFMSLKTTKGQVKRTYYDYEHFTNDIAETTVVHVNPGEILIVPTPCDILPLVVGQGVRMGTASFSSSFRIPNNHGLILAYAPSNFWQWNKKRVVCKNEDEDELLKVMQKCLSTPRENQHEWRKSETDSTCSKHFVIFSYASGEMRNNVRRLGEREEKEESVDFNGMSFS